MKAKNLVQILALCGAMAGGVGAVSLDRNIAVAGEHSEKRLKKYRKELLVDRLTPELYAKDSKEFDGVLAGLKDFLWNKKDMYRDAGNLEAYFEDKEKVVSALMQNLSLNGKSLIGSVNKSEEIRKILVQQSINWKRFLTK